MTDYKKNQIVTLDDSAYIAAQVPTGKPGVDPSWVLLARGVPAPVTEGQVLTIVGGKWVSAAPTGGSGGGGTPESGGILHRITPSTASTGDWSRNADAQYGTLTSDGTVLTLTSNYAGQFVRYVYTAERMPHPLALAPTEIQFDLFIPSAGSAGMSAGMVLSNTGDAGHYNFRVDVNADGSFGVRFEQDGQSNIFSTPGAGPFTLDAWHTVRFVRSEGSAVAFIDGEFVAGVDGGPLELADGVTVLVYGGSSGSSQARFRNITATTHFGYGDSSAAGGGGTSTPASPTAAGIVRLATASEASDGTSATTAITPATLQAKIDALPDPTPVSAATTTAAGIVRLATAAEVTAGTSTDTVMTTAQVAAAAAAGGGGKKSSLVIGPTDTLQVPGIWIQTDAQGNLVTVFYDDHNGTGGSNSDGQVAAGQTNPLTGPGLWLVQDSTGAFTGLVYDDGGH